MKTAEKACRARGYATPSFVDVRTGRRIPFGTRHNTLSYASAEAMAAAFGGDPSYIPSQVGFIYAPSDGGFVGAITRRQSWESLLDELAANAADVQVVPFSYSPSLGGETAAGGSSDSSSSGSGSGGGGGEYVYTAWTTDPAKFQGVPIDVIRGFVYSSEAYAAYCSDYGILGQWTEASADATHLVLDTSMVSIGDVVATRRKIFIPDSGPEEPSGPDEDGDYTNVKPTGSNAITFHAVSNSQDAGVRETAAFKTDDYIYQAVLLGQAAGKYYVLSRVSLFDERLGKYLQKPADFEVALDWTVVFR